MKPLGMGDLLDTLIAELRRGKTAELESHEERISAPVEIPVVET